MKISADVFEAFLKCSTKCWLRAAGEPPSCFAISPTLHTRCLYAAKLLIADVPANGCDVGSVAENLKTAECCLAVGVELCIPFVAQDCGAVFPPQGEGWTLGKFRLGSEIIAYALYLNIELRLPQIHVDQSLNKLFGFHFPIGDTTHRIKEQAAKIYHKTYEGLLTRLCSGRLLHADETKIGIRGNDGFVWVFANMEEVAYVYRETREGDFLLTMLKDFKGVLVSDFYAAYEAIPCPQQKCLIHLIRDLNDDVLKHPYDDELKRLTLAFAVLLKPMVETVDRYGLKSRFLRKHLSAVDRFYRHISDVPLQSEIAIKVKERLEKNRFLAGPRVEHQLGVDAHQDLSVRSHLCARRQEEIRRLRS